MSNAKIIIIAVIGLLVVDRLILNENQPGWVQALGGVASFVCIVGLVGFLFLRSSAWFELAKEYPVKWPVSGPWQTCRTAVIARVSRDDPSYERQKVRLVFILRVAATADALNLAVIPFLRALVPPLQIPWSAILSARAFDAGGWVRAPRDPGALLQLTYDPGYTGRFVELQIRQPQVFIHLPAQLLGNATAQLPIESDHE